MISAILITCLIIAVYLFSKDYRPWSSKPELEKAITVNHDGTVRFRMNSSIINSWKELVVVGARVRTITMKRDTPKVQIHVCGKYFVFLSGDGLICSERNVQAYRLFEEHTNWVITQVDGIQVTICVN